MLILHFNMLVVFPTGQQFVLDLQNMQRAYRNVVNELYSPDNKMPTNQQYYKSGPTRNREENLYDLATDWQEEGTQSKIYDTPPDVLYESDNESDYATVRFEK